MRVIRYIDTISEYTGIVCAWLVIPLMLVVMYEVVARYWFNAPTGWGYDTGWMLYSAQFMIGGAYTLLHRGHIRIDIVYGVLSPRARVIYDTVLYAVVLLPVSILFTWAGIKFAAMAWAADERLSTTNWFFPSGPSKTVIPAAFFLLALQGLAGLLRKVAGLTQGRHDES